MDMIASQKIQNVPLITSFFRYNAMAITATVCDMSILIFCQEILHLDLRASAFIGAFCGGAVAFLMGRNWTYINKEGQISSQGIKFLAVWGGSVLLNTFGVYFFAETLQVGHYTIAKILTASMIGVLYNFPMQRYFVFR